MYLKHYKTKPLIAIFTITAIIFTLIIIVGRVLVPFIIALILSYILNPLIEKLEYKFKISRKLSSFLFAILLFILLVVTPFFVIPALINEIKNIIQHIPNIIITINLKIINPINLKYNLDLHLDSTMIKEFITYLRTLSNSQQNIFAPIAHNSLLLIEIIVYALLIPYILFYCSYSWQKIINFCDNLIPRSYATVVHIIVKDIDQMLASYLRGQVVVMLIMMFYYATVLSIVKAPFAIAVGVISGFLVFIPYFGVMFGLSLAILISFAQLSSLHIIIKILIAFLLGHVLEGALITPFLIGGRIGLNPVLIILMLMIFGKLFGIIGILLALPLATITLVLLKYLKYYYTKSEYYSEKKPI